MKSLFKVTLLATTMAFALNATQVIAADTAKPADTAETAAPVKETAPSTGNFKSEAEKVAYAVGASLGSYMDNSLKENEKLGFKLDRDLILSGVQDVFANKSQLNDADIQKTLQAFEVQVKTAVDAKAQQDAKMSEERGNEYRAAFAKEKDVKKTESGLLYLVEKEGSGEVPQNSDTVVVNYKGILPDGKEFDNSYTRGEPLSFRLDGVIPGWTEGLKQIKKGGKIKLVIPPALAYGEAGVPGIPANSTLIFEVELLDLKPAPKEDKKAEKPAAAVEVKAK